MKKSTGAVVRMATIYEKPLDYPDSYVVRCWTIRGGVEPAPDDVCSLHETLESARWWCREHGFSGFFTPSPGDDAKIKETWI